MAGSPAILIVDDDVVLSDLYRIKFERAGYTVAVCHDGQSAFNELQKGLQPSVIVLDLIMPVMDGITFLREATYKLKLPPIIVMTSEEADAKRLDALLHGAHAYLIKAVVTPADVLEQIKSLLKKQVA